VTGSKNVRFEVSTAELVSQFLGKQIS